MDTSLIVIKELGDRIERQSYVEHIFASTLSPPDDRDFDGDLKIRLDDSVFHSDAFLILHHSRQLAQSISNGLLDLVNVVSKHDFVQVHRWMYCVEIESTSITSTLESLESVARLLHLTGLVDECSAAKRLAFTSPEAANIYEYAQRHGYSDLRQHAFQLMRDDLKGTSVSTEFINLPIDIVHALLSDDFLQVKSELEVLEVALRWLSHAWDSRLTHAPLLISDVRFQLMSNNELVRVTDEFRPDLDALKTKIILENPECQQRLLSAYRDRLLINDNCQQLCGTLVQLLGQTNTKFNGVPLSPSCGQRRYKEADNQVIYLNDSSSRWKSEFTFKYLNCSRTRRDRMWGVFESLRSDDFRRRTCEIEFIVGTRSFLIHRFLLNHHNPVIAKKAMDGTPRRRSVFHLGDVVSSSAFDIIYRWMYADTIVGDVGVVTAETPFTSMTFREARKFAERRHFTEFAVRCSQLESKFVTLSVMNDVSKASSLGHPTPTEAAILIQKTFRGFRVRKNLKYQKSQKEIHDNRHQWIIPENIENRQSEEVINDDRSTISDLDTTSEDLSHLSRTWLKNRRNRFRKLFDPPSDSEIDESETESLQSSSSSTSTNYWSKVKGTDDLWMSSTEDEEDINNDNQKLSRNSDQNENESKPVTGSAAVKEGDRDSELKVKQKRQWPRVRSVTRRIRGQLEGLLGDGKIHDLLERLRGNDNEDDHEIASIDSPSENFPKTNQKEKSKTISEIAGNIQCLLDRRMLEIRQELPPNSKTILKRERRQYTNRKWPKTDSSFSRWVQEVNEVDRSSSLDFLKTRITIDSEYRDSEIGNSTSHPLVNAQTIGRNGLEMTDWREVEFLVDASEHLLIGGHIVVVESNGGNRIRSPMIRLDVKEMRWIDQGPMPFTRRNAAVVINQIGDIFITGGFKPSSLNQIESATATVHSYRQERGWKRMKSMSSARVAHSAAIIGELLVVIGGLDERGRVLSSVEGFRWGDESQTSEWIHLPSLPIPRMGMAIHVHDDGRTIFIAGGLVESSEGGGSGHRRRVPTDSVLTYRLGFDNWRKLDCLRKPKAFASLMGNEIGLFLVGGIVDEPDEDDPDQWHPVSTDEIEVYNPDTGKWELETQMSQPRHRVGAIFIGDYLMVIGGSQLPTKLTLITSECYDVRERQWLYGMPELPYPVYGGTMVTVVNQSKSIIKTIQVRVERKTIGQSQFKSIETTTDDRLAETKLKQ